MRRPVLLAALASLALPAAASAAPATISPNAATLGPSGVATIEAANPNAYVLSGRATVTVGGKKVLSRSVRLGKRSVGQISLRFGRSALTALQARNGRATITLRVRRAGGKATTARRTITIRPAAGAAPQAPAAPKPVSDKWVGRMGTEGGYDDLELTVVGGQLQITKAPTVPVACMENGGGYDQSTSFELFDAPGPFPLGADAEVKKEAPAVNQMVGSSPRTITYKVKGAAQTADRVTGTLAMSFFESKYDPFSNSITFINCFGEQGFEAIPA